MDTRTERSAAAQRDTREPAGVDFSISTPHRAAVFGFWKLAPYVVGIFFGLWGLRGVAGNHVVYADAARHALNGVFIRDLIANGQWTNPIGYGKYYFAHLPALSLPFHPPLFPAFESLFFGLFGVNLLSARLAVALTTAAAIILLWRFLTSTGIPSAPALGALAAFSSLPVALFVASDVMLEFPALLASAAALYCLRDLDREYTLRRGIWFAIFCGAAFWTKQNTVFLGAIPFAYILVARRWRLLVSPVIWISSVLAGAAVFALFWVSSFLRGTSFNQAAPPDWVRQAVSNNLSYYAKLMSETFGLVPTLLLGAATLWLLFPFRGKRSLGVDLSVAWTVSCVPVLLLLGYYEERYLFFLYPPLLVLAFVALWRLGVVLGRQEWAAYAPAALALLFLGAGFRHPPEYLQGPVEAAKTLISGAPKRILYCGTTVNGPFIFAVRTLDPQLKNVIIGADKLDLENFAPAALERFARRYGITHVVVEFSGRDEHWNPLRAHSPSSMHLEREVPVRSSHATWNGSLKIYSVASGSEAVETNLPLMIDKIGGAIDVPLESSLKK